MKAAFSLLLLFLGLASSLAFAEPPTSVDRAEKALRALLRPGARVLEANPAYWDEKMWDVAGLTPDDWAQAMARWEASDPELRARIEQGRAYQWEYLARLADDAKKQIDPKSDRPAPLERLIRDYTAFVAAQKRFNLGPPTELQAEDFANNATVSFRTLIEAGDQDPFLKEAYKRAHGKAKHRAEQSEFPAKDKGAEQSEWDRWKERNRELAESEILERFKAAVAAVQSKPGMKVWADGKRVEGGRLRNLELTVNWAEGKIQSASGKDLEFQGDEKLKKELEGFLGAVPVAAADGLMAERDPSWTVARRLRLEALAIKYATAMLDRTTAKISTKRVSGSLYKLAGEVKAELADPIASSPLKKLARTPNETGDASLEAVLWSGYKQSPQFFKRTWSLFRLAVPLEQVASGRKILSRTNRRNLPAYILVAVMATLGLDQAWQHREQIHQWSLQNSEKLARYLEDHVDPERLPAFVREWVDGWKQGRESRGGGGQGSALQNGTLDLPSDGFRSNDKLPATTEVIKRVRTPYDDYSTDGEPLTTGMKGFSREPTTPYDMKGELAKLPQSNPPVVGNVLEVKTQFPLKTENGKVLIPHSEGFLLSRVELRLNPLNGGSPVPYSAGRDGDLLKIERSGRKYYVIDLNQAPQLAERFDLSSVGYGGEYTQLPRADYLQKELAISDPNRVRELANHFQKAGFGRIAEGFREEAEWMKKLGYSIYPNDVGKRIEMGSLYSETKNPKSKIRVDAGNLFADVLDLAVEDHLCTQCAGSAEVSERALKFLYAGTDVKVRKRTVLPAARWIWTIPYHAQIEVQSGDNPVVVVDATAKVKDPRNSKENIPTTDVLHSAGQKDPFADLPELDGPDGPKVAEGSGEKPASDPQRRENREAPPSREPGPWDDFAKELSELPPANHRFRNRGQIPGTEDDTEPVPEGANKKMDPRILEAVRKIDKVRQALMDEPAYRRLPAGVRAAERSMPLSMLFRSYLLGEVTKEKLHEGMRFLLSENSPLRAVAAPSTQAMLREIALEQKATMETILEKARGAVTPTLKSMADPAMADSIVAVFEEMAKVDADALVSPPKKPGTRARLAACANWMLKVARLR